MKGAKNSFPTYDSFLLPQNFVVAFSSRKVFCTVSSSAQKTGWTIHSEKHLSHQDKLKAAIEERGERPTLFYLIFPLKFVKYFSANPITVIERMKKWWPYSGHLSRKLWHKIEHLIKAWWANSVNSHVKWNVKWRTELPLVNYHWS